LESQRPRSSRNCIGRRTKNRELMPTVLTTEGRRSLGEILRNPYGPEGAARKTLGIGPPRATVVHTVYWHKYPVFILSNQFRSRGSPSSPGSPCLSRPRRTQKFILTHCSYVSMDFRAQTQRQDRLGPVNSRNSCSRPCGRFKGPKGLHQFRSRVSPSPPRALYPSRPRC